MTDLPAMDPCPTNESGIHRMEGIGLLATEGDAASLTWVCRYCGALRQVPGFGPLLAPRLDDQDAAQIMADATVFGRLPWETR